MKRISIIVLAVLVLVGVSTAAKISKSKTRELQIDLWSGEDEEEDIEPDEIGSASEKLISTSCGGVLTGESGEIHYKYGESFAGAEGCIWTISVVNRSEITIKVLETFSRDHAGHYFQVGFFNKSAYDNPASFTWIRLPIHLSPQELTVPGPIAFVQFVTCGAYLGLGFKLGFEAVGDEQTSIYGFENYFVTGTSGIFKYPVTGDKYKNNQRTTIVVDSPTITNSFLFVQRQDVEGSEGCIADSINAYKFTYASPQGTWDRAAILCGAEEVATAVAFNTTAVGHHDPIIITFKTDDSTVGKGFELWWNLNN